MSATTKSHGGKLCVIAVLMLAVALPIQASAFTTEQIPGDEVVGDFVVGPGKVEVFLNPGESKTVELLITNRTGVDKVFGIDIEDFVGSQNVQETVVLLGSQRGPYSLKDYVVPETDEFVLGHAQRARMPVTISIPPDAEPGGLYGSVLVNIVSESADAIAEGGASGGAAIVSRIGVLFFVRVSGDVVEDGNLKEFGLSGNRNVLTKTPVTFNVLFENNGNVHLNPYGLITVENLLGEVIGERVVEPWFVLPDSLRLRELDWDRPLLIGRYTAKAQINRGYDDIIDEAETTFWVLPLNIILAALAVIALVILLIYFLRSRFEIRKKSKDTSGG